jgi:hypothetical protein
MGASERQSTVTEDFPSAVKAVVGPTLTDLGFLLDEIDNNVDEGGRRGSVVYYRSDDCKIQIYKSSREGSVNCMIAPLDAVNAFGPGDQTYKWVYLNDFSPAPDVPLEELVKSVSFEPKTDIELLEWVRDRIGEYFPEAHAAIIDN